MIGELHRVAGQVEQDLPQMPDIATQCRRDRLGHLHPIVQALGLGLRQQDQADGLDHFGKNEILGNDAQFAGLDRRDVQHFLDQRQQAAR
ncbi:hypothetical protein D3C72_2338220 [compost metagenome]